MNRERLLEQINGVWDVLIIGGGATGLGAAVDSASRGYRTLLLEQSDFAKGTSSRSTKLIHGGLRYLKQGNLALVTEALKERGLLCQNAPHLVTHLPFLVPSYHWWEGPFYGAGLHLYDLLAGKLGIEKSQSLSREETLQKLPTLHAEGLRGAHIYYDGQFDDARLAITLAATAVDLGAVVLNYVEVVGLIKEQGRLVGVEARDVETDRLYQIRAKAVIQATGVFSDRLRQLDAPKTAPLVAPSQGGHLVMDRSFLPSDTALMIPSTEDGRVLFFVPWHHHLLIGTTDTPVKEASLEPRPLDEEVEFLLHHAARYLNKPPKRQDILSQFAGLRPLVRSDGAKNTAALSRDHVIVISESGLITITGGKWTTYRKMGQDVVDKAMTVGRLEEKPSRTESLRLHEPLPQKQTELLHVRLPYFLSDLVAGVRGEMARTVEDLLARRTRALFLDARAAAEIAPVAAKLLARELGRSDAWAQEQVQLFNTLSKRYLP